MNHLCLLEELYFACFAYSVEVLCLLKVLCLLIPYTSISLRNVNPLLFNHWLDLSMRRTWQIFARLLFTLQPKSVIRAKTSKIGKNIKDAVVLGWPVGQADF